MRKDNSGTLSTIPKSLRLGHLCGFLGIFLAPDFSLYQTPYSFLSLSVPSENQLTPTFIFPSPILPLLLPLPVYTEDLNYSPFLGSFMFVPLRVFHFTKHLCACGLFLYKIICSVFMVKYNLNVLDRKEKYINEYAIDGC